MSIVDGVRRGVIAALIAGLAIAPVLSAKPFARAAKVVLAPMQEPSALAVEESEQEREQEKRDREQERIDRMQELYDDGREELDDDKYQQAADKFSELVKMNGPQTDAALY